MKKIDFLIVGAQKSGTTSLFEYLSCHDEIFMPSHKELDFFSNDEKFSKGVSFYHNFFTESPSKKILGEASPQYMYLPETAKRISEYCSEIKIIMCLRDPVERAFSHYRMNKRRLKENDSFEVVISKQIDAYAKTGCCSNDPEFNYLGLGLYGDIIENFLRYFDRSQIKIVWSESLDNDRKKTVDTVLNFLGTTHGIDETEIQNSFHSGGEQRFPLLYKVFLKFSTFSGTFNLVIKKIFGEKRVYRALYRFETLFSVKPIKSEADPRAQELLKHFFAGDAQKIASLTKIKVPWK